MLCPAQERAGRLRSPVGSQLIEMPRARDWELQRTKRETAPAYFLDLVLRLSSVFPT